MNPFADVNWNPGLAEKRKFALSLIIGFPLLAGFFSLVLRLATHSWKPFFLWLAIIGFGAGVILWLLPAIAYGDAWSAEGWAGTLSISPATLRATIIDIGRGLKRLGVSGLVTVNGHFGNREPIALAARTLLEIGLPLLHLDYPGLEAAAAEFCSTKPAGPGFYHADEVETAMMLALAPESVRMDRAVAEYPKFPPTFGSEPLQLHSFNTSGVFGDPRAATAETGEKLIGCIVAESVRLVDLWQKAHA
jgi:creatinine amidohydrolase